MSAVDVIRAAVVAFDAERLAEAEILCRLALREAPYNADALYILGRVHSDRGDDSEAARLLQQVLFFSPRYIAAYPHLAHYYYAMRQVEDSLRLLTAWTAVDPSNPEAQHLMAAITGNEPSQRCSEGYIKTYFNEFASSFDHVLLQKLAYRGPEIVAAAFQKYCAGSQRDVLDAGCGTGLCGPGIRSWCRKLVGVDLAERMIHAARERKCYSELVVGEVCAVMESRLQAFDAVIAADVLIYFGALDHFLGSARGSLRPGGILIITTESLPEDARERYRLLLNGRYAHRKSYVVSAVDEAGFEVAGIRDECIRWELGQNVMGHCIVAVRAANST
jgi:predicted TPR repeat methyltransferase